MNAKFHKYVVAASAAVLAWGSLVPSAMGQAGADVFAQPGTDLSRPADRDRVVKALAKLEADRRANARARAAQLGLPARTVLPNGGIREIAGFSPQGKPLYFTTHNANAAISTAANLVRTSPYNLTGAGVTVGIWDGGAVRSTHQELAGRVTVMDGAAAAEHSSHVGGTIGATGVIAAARGMAGSASIASYDWNSDTAEMTARGASAPGVPASCIYVSNHSYGYGTGWSYTGGTGSPARTWEWSGNGTTTSSYDYDFGMYNSDSRTVDSLAFSAPYYLIFQSAGNDRVDAPANGDMVALSPGSTTVVAYSSTTYPPGDNAYRGGFDTIGYRALGKNVMTVGAVGDAVSGGVRSLAGATMTSFSSWGPTDDGRIKPDVVANGYSLYSSTSTSDTAYGYMSGTSMASPNATGSAALLVQHYANLFSGGVMRASTLKGLLIHSADDLGNVGPDYKFGWGLVNTKAAADLLTDHQANPLKQRVTENQLTTATTTRTVSFVWDGASPISATLCWTDPAGASTTTTDSRTARLVNNLDLKIIAPDGSQYLPYVMPFVGTWTQASMDLPATTGVNNTDNVEQVRIAAPSVAGTYQAVVSFSGTLTNSQQNYSLLLSGSAAVTPPPPALSLSAVSPASALSQGVSTLTLTGAGFRADTVVALTKTGETAVTATAVTLVNSTTLTCQVDLTGKTAGLWDVVATNTGGSNPGSATLAGSFTVVGAIWAQNFDGSVTGWASSSGSGNNSWALTGAKYQSASKSYFCSGPSTGSSTYLTSPVVAIPSGASGIQLKFWHWYSFQSRKDGGFIQLSVDGGATWFDPTAASSGVTFSANGTVNTLNSSTNPFNGKSVWTGSTSAFVETVLNFTDTAKFAGKNFRVRWCCCTNNGTSSTGWYVDTVSLVAGGNLTNAAPVIATAPSSGSTEIVTDADSSVHQVIRAATAALAVTATDDAGEAGLTYGWSVLSGPSGAAFSANQSNAAKSTTIEFPGVGDYVVGVTVTDAQSASVSGSVNLRVQQTASGLTVSPLLATTTVDGTVQFSASLIDQFGAALATQPSFAWNASGGGSVDSTGLFTATAAGSGYVVSATASGFTNSGTVVVNPAAATVTLSNLAHTYDSTAKQAVATTTPTGLPVSITYDGSSALPVNAGSYAVVAAVTDPNYTGSATGTLTISLGNNYAGWQVREFSSAEIAAGAAADNSDPDGDGLTNLAEYALGTNPHAFTPMPQAAVSSGNLALTFTRPSGLSDVQYSAQHSDQLATWDPAALEVITTDGTTDTVRVSVPLATGDPSRHFIRLVFTRP